MDKLNILERPHRVTIDTSKLDIILFVQHLGIMVDDESPLPQGAKEISRKIFHKLIFAALTKHERIVVASQLDDSHAFFKLANFNHRDKELINNLREKHKIIDRGQNG
ncbi:MAG: hypothetical protein KF816_11600 [Melioribacteraceae bacterium]|nr:hypothetical protein [Melioribacteraceae bacterium]